MNQNQPENNNNNTPIDSGVESPESQARRDLINKLGKFAIYAAPFTVMALNARASSGHGPKKH